MNLIISIFLIFISYFSSFYRRKENSNNFNLEKKKKRKRRIRFSSRIIIESCVRLTDPIEWKTEQGRKCVIISCILIGEMETGNGDRSGENEMAGQ